ncbi:MAG TPA: hypothetical protein DD761_20165 [Cyanobacteria bacterium UBA11691]|nr:hypothetical protein [Cyanobacteria bacterium UBA11691]
MDQFSKLSKQGKICIGVLPTRQKRDPITLEVAGGGKWWDDAIASPTDSVLRNPILDPGAEPMGLGMIYHRLEVFTMKTTKKVWLMPTLQKAKVILVSLIVIYYLLEIASVVILVKSGEIEGEILNIKAFNFVFHPLVFWFLLKGHPAARWTIVVTEFAAAANFLSSSGIAFLAVSFNEELVLVESWMMARLVTLPIELLFPVALLWESNIKRFFEFKKSKWIKSESSVVTPKFNIFKPQKYMRSAPRQVQRISRRHRR